MTKAAITFLVLFFSSPLAAALSHGQLDAVVEEGITKGYYPGASLVVGRGSGVIYSACYGWTESSHAAAVAPGTLYDLASCTKIVATTLAMMRLYDTGQVDLSRRVGDYVTLYDGSPVAGVTLLALLTHTSGLPDMAISPHLVRNSVDSLPLTDKTCSAEYPQLVEPGCYLCAKPLYDSLYLSFVPVPSHRRSGENLYVAPAVDTLLVGLARRSWSGALAGRYRYSDVNFMILRQIVEHITARPFGEYCAGLFAELGMRNTGFAPLGWAAAERIAPTNVDFVLGRGLVCGYPNDMRASVAAGCAEGSAGLFADAADLALFCRMMLGGGSLDGRQFVRASTVKYFISMPLYSRKIYRGLGFDRSKPTSPLWGGYGHTGYTGPIVWIDPQCDRFMVLLCNRVNPSMANTGLIRSNLRNRLWEVVKKIR
ncbi:MAG: beta-lactamase family protein [Rikenellaceae bacterium]|nr:beta-lactamase family protein [Rikenellaceae bacterium]